jgi:CubicO group peptidase (beta-lactamase class C family)
MKTEFFNGLLQGHPIFPTSTTPIYSNAAFQVIGYVVEALSGENFQTVLEKAIIYPLKLTHTFYTTPSTKLGVIPSTQGEYYWNFAMGDETP